jgi:hypothetical protein
MQNALSRDVTEFSGFNRVQRILTRPKPVKHVIAVAIARMDRGALIPVAAVHFDGVGHGQFMRHGQTSRKACGVW